MRLDTGTIVGGRYEIKEKLGVGGMAIVYKALDMKLDRPVTFKVMREELSSDQDFIKRFNIEAKAAAKLSHQNIVNVYDVGQEDGVYFIVMEYVEGTTLKDLITKSAPFSDAETLGVGIQIASALDSAHTNGIIHRDIKPQNILVTPEGKIKVTDFGIARATSSTTVTTTSNTMGSVHYFSPEQAKGRFVDVRSDIYSLGIVLFEMTTGMIPYDGDTPVAIAIKHLNDPLPDIRAFNPAISRNLENIILKATQKVSTNRYESSECMCNDLKRALTNLKGDFTKEVAAEVKSPTVSITQEEISIIRNKSKNEYVEKRNLDDLYEDDSKEEYEYENEEIDKTAERKIIIAAISTAALIILILSLIAFNIYRGSRPKTVKMPNLSGMTVEEASIVLNELGLNVVNAYQAYDSDIPKDCIILQSYKEGDYIHVGMTVEVSVSLGSDMIPVPNVVTKELSEALEDFDGLYFKVTHVGEFSGNVPIGVVIRQEPPGNSEALINSEIILYVSQGPQMKFVKVPELRNLTEAQAITKLESEGLVVGHISRQEHSTVSSGLVIDQTITASREVIQGTVVGIIVSSGPPVRTSPSPTPTPSPTPSASPTPTPSPTPSASPTPTPSPTPTASSTPSPTPTPTPTPSPTPSPTPTANVPTISTKQLPINPAFAEGVEKVNVEVLKITSQGSSVIYEKEHSVADFPLSLSVTGEGVAEYVLLVDGKHNGSSIINFSE